MKRLTWQLVVGREKGSRLGHCVGRALRSHLSEREREKEMIEKKRDFAIQGRIGKTAAVLSDLASLPCCTGQACLSMVAVELLVQQGQGGAGGGGQWV